MGYINAKRHFKPTELVYIVICGKGYSGVGYERYFHFPSASLKCRKDYKEVLNITFEGVRFCIFDYPPFAPNIVTQAIMSDVIKHDYS